MVCVCANGQKKTRISKTLIVTISTTDFPRDKCSNTQTTRTVANANITTLHFPISIRCNFLSSAQKICFVCLVRLESCSFWPKIDYLSSLFDVLCLFFLIPRVAAVQKPQERNWMYPTNVRRRTTENENNDKQNYSQFMSHLQLNGNDDSSLLVRRVNIQLIERTRHNAHWHADNATQHTLGRKL